MKDLPKITNLEITDKELNPTSNDILRTLEEFCRLVKPLIEISTRESDIGISSCSHVSNYVHQIPPQNRHLLNFREAAMLLSMSEASLRDLVHKGQGPENVRRGKRVCFTNEGLQRYVDGLPREYPYQGVIETINAKGSRPASIEEQRAFGV